MRNDSRNQTVTSQCCWCPEGLNSITAMNTSISSMTGLARIAALFASFLVLAVLLAGCSSSAPDSEAAAEVPASEVDAGGEAVEGGSDASDSSTANRSIIITGSMYMTVEDPLGAADKAATIVKDAGGRIDGRSENAPDEGTGGSAELTLRIPTNRLDAVVEDLRALGTVDEYKTTASDVTNQVTDLDARISTLRASTERIEALLVEAKDITDIIKLEDELASRQGELESLEAEQRGLTDQVSLSTIELSLTTVPVVIVEDDSPATFFDGLASGWNGLTNFISAALVVFGVLLPWLIVMALIAIGIVAAVRMQNARAAAREVKSVEQARAEEAPAAEAPSAPSPMP